MCVCVRLFYIYVCERAVLLCTLCLIPLRQDILLNQQLDGQPTPGSLLSPPPRESGKSFSITGPDTILCIQFSWSPAHFSLEWPGHGWMLLFLKQPGDQPTFSLLKVLHGQLGW